MRMIWIVAIVILAPAYIFGQDDAGPPNTPPQVLLPQVTTPQFGVMLPPTDQPLIGFTLSMMPNDEYQSLHDPSVTKDLELVPDQIEKIEGIQKQYSDRFQSLVKKLMNAGTDPDQHASLKKQIVEFHAERSKSIEKVLLPHQLARIKQINRQNLIELSGGVSSAFQNADLAKKLSLTDEQLTGLKDIQQKMLLEIAEKTRQCRETARTRTLKMLTADQRKILNELTGDRFVRENTDWVEKYGQHKSDR
ncbi:MAG: hypothetical protein AAFN77_12035 [Planctomycetota bacterium]